MNIVKNTNEKKIKKRNKIATLKLDWKGMKLNLHVLETINRVGSAIGGQVSLPSSYVINWCKWLYTVNIIGILFKHFGEEQKIPQLLTE